MPQFQVSSVRKIDRSKQGKPPMYIGHCEGSDYFLWYNLPEHQQILDMAVQAKTSVTVTSTNFEKPKAGSMFVQSLDAE